MTDDRRRRLHLLVPDSAGRVLADTGGRLPVVTITLRPDDTTVAAARRTAAERWAVTRPVLEVLFDESGSGDEDPSLGAAGAVATAVVVFEPPADAGPAPAGLVWSDDVDGSDLPVELRRRAEGWRAEWRGAVTPDRRRARWSQAGWYDRMSSWVDGRLAEHGRRRVGPVEQRRHWSISAVLRSDTDRGPVWAKAVFPLFGHEPVVTAFIDAAAPGSVAPVLAVDVEEGWLLLEDIGSVVVSERPEVDDDAIRRLVALQQSFIGRTAALAAVGFPARPFSDLPDQLNDVLGDGDLRAWLDVAPDRAAAIVSWVAAGVEQAAAVGLPDTIVHGDFHPENVAFRDGRAIVFDWSDAAVANPLVDAMTWSTWLEDDAARGERAWEVFLDAWCDVVPAERVRAARPTLTGLTAAYHTVSYAEILRALEPALRNELGDGLRAYGTALDTAVPR